MIPEHELRQMYWNEKMPINKIAKEVGVYPSTIFTWMKKYGIKSRTNSESQLIKSPKPSKEELEEMYWPEKMSTNDISRTVYTNIYIYF